MNATTARPGAGSNGPLVILTCSAIALSLPGAVLSGAHLDRGALVLDQDPADTASHQVGPPGCVMGPGDLRYGGNRHHDAPRPFDDGGAGSMVVPARALHGLNPSDDVSDLGASEGGSPPGPCLMGGRRPVGGSDGAGPVALRLGRGRVDDGRRGSRLRPHPGDACRKRAVRAHPVRTSPHSGEGMSDRLFELT